MFSQAFGEIERRRAADIVSQIAIHFRLERRIGFGVGVSLFQIEDQRHQRFRDKAAAENAEMAALVGTAAEGIGQISIHRTFNSCCRAATLSPLLGPALAGRGEVSSAARTARMKARIISGSLTPGARSTPEETSTPPAPVTLTASATFWALRPPETMNGSLRSRFSSTCQSNTAPSPPGRVASFGATASNKIRSAAAA